MENAAVLCENHRESHANLNYSPSEGEERKFFWLSGNFLVQYFHDAFYNLAIFEIFERAYFISIYYTSMLSLRIESTNSMITLVLKRPGYGLIGCSQSLILFIDLTSQLILEVGVKVVHEICSHLRKVKQPLLAFSLRLHGRKQ